MQKSEATAPLYSYLPSFFGSSLSTLLTPSRRAPELRVASILIALIFLLGASNAFAFEVICKANSDGTFDLRNSHDVQLSANLSSSDCNTLKATLHYTDTKRVYICGKTTGSSLSYDLVNAYTGKRIEGGGFASAKDCAGEMNRALFGKSVVCAQTPDLRAIAINLVDEKSIGTEFDTIASCQSKVAHSRATPLVQLKTGTQFNLWNPTPSAVGFTFKHCQDSTRDNHLIGSTPDGGYISNDCVPDTLYSWGDSNKLEWFKQNWGVDAWTETLSRELFSTLSPSGSYAYGPIAMRLKVKPGVRFKLSRSSNNRPCSSASTSEKSNTIFVISWLWGPNDGVDYIICSGDVIESWSYDTKEHYDEVARDVNWVATHRRGEYALYAEEGSRWWYLGQDEIASENGFTFSEETLEGNLTIWNQEIARGHGGIFYNTGVTHERARHFSTAHPIYFNPGLASAQR